MTFQSPTICCDSTSQTFSRRHRMMSSGCSEVVLGFPSSGTCLLYTSILKLAQSLKDTQKAIAVANDEKMVMSRTISRLSNQLAQLTGNEDYVVKLPAGLKGKVVVVDPKWDFVVLDIGDEQGVLQDEMCIRDRPWVR